MYYLVDTFLLVIDLFLQGLEEDIQQHLPKVIQVPVSLAILVGAVAAFGKLGEKMGEKEITDLQYGHGILFSIAVHGVNFAAAVGEYISA